MKRALPFVLLLITAHAVAAPVITSVNGTAGQGQVLTIGVTGQGAKSPAGPYLWADFTGSLAPSTLGTQTAFDAVQNLSYTSNGGFAGTGGAVGTAGASVWTIQVNKTNWTTENQHVYEYSKVKQNFLITDASQNWKIWRLWAATLNPFPDAYAAANNGRFFVENVNTATDPGFWTDIHGFNLDTTSWAFQEKIWKASSAINTKDGSFLYRVNNQDKASGSWISRSDAAPAYMVNDFPVHFVAANTSTWSPAWSGTNNVWVDELYVDITWQRVMIGDASTLSACTKLDIQVPTGWTMSGVTTVTNVTSFSNGQTAYVYVFDGNNVANTSGWPITINGTVAGNPPPSLSSVFPSTGPYTGGGNYTLTGTNFLPSPTVTVGGVTASSTYMSSTKVDFTLPAGTPGTQADITLANTDLQSATLSHALTYGSAPISNPPIDTPIINQGKVYPAFR